MASAVQILGTAPNLLDTPDTNGERWCSGNPRAYRIKGPKGVLETYTRWFNVHTTRHIKARHPNAYEWYTEQSKPVYLQQAEPDVPASIPFPRQAIQDHFGGIKFFTCSVSWQLAFAIMEGFERIELWGFELRREHQYDWERPCFFYWVEQARSRGIDVFIPPGVEITEPGNPADYTGPLYGYEPHNEYYAEYF